ncbi:NAD(P)-dependent oxidoreductase [Vulgatibacter sp.]|uniref:NAD(P)-dependent oxidoreductase n=1 Tax=Vulgatibacter sp. TaxID=1971226 RepID=UPI003567309D
MSQQSSRPMRIAVIGASRGSGRETVGALLARGHEVVAFARDPSTIPAAPRLTLRRGDALQPSDLDGCVAGCDAVVVTLGIHENPLAVRLGIRRTPIDVRSRGTANVIAAMQRAGVRRLVVQTTYGIGSSRGRLSFGWSLAFALLLAPQIEDHERQEELVRACGLEWTLVQPVGLVDKDTGRPVMTSLTGEVRSMEVSRSRLASVLCAAAEGAFVGEVVAVSS